jgi:alkylation response protein AidB-like acyl-CoA dehydrogenase
VAVGVDLGPELEAFRSDAHSWLEANKHLAKDADAWAEAQREAGYLCPTWPKEFGGGGLTGVQVAILGDEFRKARVARTGRGMGEGLVGPAIMTHGSKEQQDYFLPRILSGTDVYCQGFSEPNAGSDLAGLRTRGDVVDGEVVITGQKVWTSGFSRANMIFCLCRTDPDAPKHQGISYVLVPIRNEDGSPNGIEFRPIKQMTGGSNFAETFIDEARAPLFNVIGGLNNGWKATMVTLGNERGGNATSQHLAWQAGFDALVNDARRLGKTADPRVRQQLAWCYTQVELMRINGLRTIGALAGGQDPGPGASVNKMFWSEYSQTFTEIATSILGPAATAGEGELSKWTRQLLGNRSHTIWGGTAEIQRNIVAERILGLPKEPEVPVST